MKRLINLVVTLAGLTALTAGALPGQNLVPNHDFSDKTDPLKEWRYVYPHQQQQYGNNQKYISVTDYNGKHCVMFTVPKSVAENQGAMVETAFIKCEPGATYQIEVDCCPNDLAMKIFTECWTSMPPEIHIKDYLRTWPKTEDRPQLIMCDRKNSPVNGKSWTTYRDTYTLKKNVTVAGHADKVPEYISIKAYVYGAGKPVFKAYVTNFRLTKVK